MGAAYLREHLKKVSDVRVRSDVWLLSFGNKILDSTFKLGEINLFLSCFIMVCLHGEVIVVIASQVF